MGTPYLNSGESIVLTTNRVSVDAVQYDIMLTTERLFFIDNRTTRFEPRIIALSTILSVQGGKTPAHDPVITLLFSPGDEGAARQPLNLVFAQNPAENRKPERDDWVRSLIQLSIRQHEKGTVHETPVIPEITPGTSLRPQARLGVQPDRVRPLSNVTERDETPAPVTVIPEEVEGSGEIPVRTAVVQQPGTEMPVPEAPPVSLTSLPRQPPSIPAPPGRVIIPQIIEELLPEKEIPRPPAGKEPEPVPEYDPEILFRAIPGAGHSPAGTEEQPPSHPLTPENAAVHEEGLFEADVAEKREIPDIIRALRIGSGEHGIPRSPEPVPEAPREQVPDDSMIALSATPEPLVTITPSEPEEPVNSTAPEAPAPQEPVSAEVPPVRHPIPPAREIRPLRTTLLYAAVIFLIIALVAAGAFLLLPKGPGQTTPSVTPSMGTLPATTLPPQPVQMTSLQPTALIPATRIVTPLPSGTPSSIPPTGVWVRVSCTAEFFGTLGNTGLMRQVSGTGDRFYPILYSDHPVQVSIQKKDNSGAMLTATIYRNGTAISTRSVTSPMGTVEILIDPVTALAPGLSPDDVLPAPAATRVALENY